MFDEDGAGSAAGNASGSFEEVTFKELTFNESGSPEPPEGPPEGPPDLVALPPVVYGGCVEQSRQVISARPGATAVAARVASEAGAVEIGLTMSPDGRHDATGSFLVSLRCDGDGLVGSQ